MYQNRHQTEEKFISMPNQWECFVNMNVLDYIDEVPYDIAARMCACVLAQSSFYPTYVQSVKSERLMCAYRVFGTFVVDRHNFVDFRVYVNK